MASWKDKGNCKGIPTRVFYPDEEDPNFEVLKQTAQDICRACPFKAECFVEAVDNGEQGIWGGVYFGPENMKPEDPTAEGKKK